VGVGPAEFRIMPDIVAGMNIRSDYTCNPRRHSGMQAHVRGTVELPAERKSHIYIGLFPDGIARSRPVAGLMLIEPGPFVLPNIPVGYYHLLCAALPASGNPLDHLVPNGSTMVGIGEPVVVRTGREQIQRQLALRPLQPTDPPILTALPALLL
jgi:AraC family transcriptional regulator